jgi:class 3 adenylate cyclase/tetratricopeptide (TPR) repeat protein
MICPLCGQENPDKAKFCNECGTALHPSQPSPASVPDPAKTVFPPEPERKIVTALFSDLTGYTALTEKLDPEQVKEITGEIFAGVKQIIAKYEGFIDRLLGDGVLAFFGIPKAHEDDPTRALQAALEIHEFVKGLSPRYEGRIGAPLSMHSGVNTGLVVTAEVDPEKGSQGVAGDAVNLAARLSGLAGAGEILVGEETVRRTKERFEFQDLGSKRVKGKAEPVAVFKLISAKAHTPSLDRQVSSAMVGRDRELNRLELQVMKVVNGEGSVVQVSGEAGIGKSRLLAELRRREVMQKVPLLEGRAISIGRNLSFYPLIDLLKQWAGISEEDAEGAAFNKLDRTIRSIHPEEADEILPFVATLMGMKLKGKYAERVQGIEGEALEKLIFKNIRELLIKGSERTPTVIIMEDLHWADTSSLLLLQSLFRLAEKYRILFINLFRPGYWQGEDRSMEKIGELLPNHTIELNIQPLDLKAGEALIGNLLNIQGLPYTLRQQIIERSGGNPFFIEEVVRSLIDDGAIVRVGTSFEVTDKINSVVVPPTINDVLIARIDRLEEKTRELVKVASVIGRNFFDRILKDVAASIEGIDNKLATLKDLQLIRDRMRMEELEYFFKHALAQEAAYESTLLEQRKQLHLKVAESIERLFSERLHEFYGILALHYSKTDNLEKTEEYMTKAGEEALRASSSSEALHYYQEGLRLYLDRYGNTADPEKIAKFEKNIGLALYNKSQWAKAIEYLEKVLDRWRAPAPKPNLSGVMHLVCDLFFVLKTLYFPSRKVKPVSSERENEIVDLSYKIAIGLAFIDYTRAFFVATAALRRTTRHDIAKIPNGPELWLASSGGFSTGGISFNLADRCLKYGRQAGSTGDILTNTPNACFSIMNRHCQGVWDEIEKVDHHLIDQGLRQGDLFHTSSYMWHLGLVKAEQGDFYHSREIIEKLFQIGETYDYALANLYAHALKADHLIKRIRASEALVESEQGLSYSHERGTKNQEMVFLGYKGEALLLLGETEESNETIARAREIHKKQRHVLSTFAAPHLVARFLADIHRLQQEVCSTRPSQDPNIRKNAYRSGKAALRHSRKYAPTRPKIFRMMGLYYWLIGKQSKALKWWERTIQEGERLGARPDLARTYLEVGKRLLEPQSKYRELNGIGAQEYLDKAEKLFREMELEWDLEQLERVRGGG